MMNKLFDEIMRNKKHTMIIDGSVPVGQCKFRNEETGETVVVNIMEEEAMTNETNETINNTNAQEEETMTNNTIATVNAVETKEEKKMTLKERHEARKAMITKKVLEASNKSGYGIGYGTRTATNEVKYAASKVKNTVCGTKVVEAFTDGYYNGKNNADYDFAQRCVKREEKARAKADAKAVKAAVQEIMDEFEF